MAEFPALPLWTDAYLGDTTHLTTIEHGAYLLLLMAAWRTRDCMLPDDDKLLARYARCSASQWKRIRPIIARFFSISSDGWRQGRLTDEANRVRQLRETQSANGRASALKRKGRHATDRNDDRERSENLGASSTDREPRKSVNEASTPIPIPTYTLSKDNAGSVDPDKQFWDMAKGYLGASKASKIGQWVSKFGRDRTAAAIAAAQVERAVDPVAFIEGRFRAEKRAEGRSNDDPDMPLYA